MSALFDPFGRKIDYVRLSIIDQCNFQCFYCRPELLKIRTGVGSEYLSIQDIERLFSVLTARGVRKVKLTGGEPLLRKDILEIVEALSRYSSIVDLSLTTNGFFLKALAADLKRRGLKRINVSLDSLNAETFHRVTATPTFHKVREGIVEALEVGLEPVKLNVVLMKGINDNEVRKFARLTLEEPLTVRFIEFMPTALNQEAQKQYYCSNQWAAAEIEKEFMLVPHIELFRTGPSRYYRIPGGKGLIGFISPLSQNFCDRCNRIRITARGELKLCLFSKENFSLLPALRTSHWKEAVCQFLDTHLLLKPKSHHLEDGEVGNVASFVNVGG